MATTKTLADELCELLNRQRYVFRRGVPPATVNRMVRAEIAGRDLREAAGTEQIRDGYRMAPLAECDFGELRALIRDARETVRALDREIAALQERRERLTLLLANPS